MGLDWWPDERFLKKKYYLVTDERLNLEHPRSFNAIYSAVVLLFQVGNNADIGIRRIAYRGSTIEACDHVYKVSKGKIVLINK